MRARVFGLGLLSTLAVVFPRAGLAAQGLPVDEAAPTPTQVDEPVTAPAQSEELAPLAPDVNLFEDMPAPPAPTVDEGFEARAQRRRSMLSTHQALGLTTLGLMLGSSVVGQLNYNDLYSADHAGSGNFLIPHRVLTYVSTASFLTTAGFSILAPKSYEKRKRFDTATAHKIAVTGATLGMLTQVGLGFATARFADAGNPKDLSGYARAHQVVGFTTTGFMAVAATVWIF